MNILGVLGTQDQSPLDDSVMYINLGTPIIGGQNLFEVIAATRKPTSGEYGSITYNYDDEKLFGFATIAETTEQNLQSLSEHIYNDLFTVISVTGFNKLWRVWNYVPAINYENELGERYKQFNAGRATSFDLKNYPKGEGSPAACGVGTDSDKLIICFLAGRVAPKTIENNRQISSYNYPTKYGNIPPIFSRAATVDSSNKVLFVSGTASIVGHDTLHIDDIEKQTEETFANIRALLDQLPDIDHSSLVHKVYIRNPEHFSLVEPIVNKYVPGPVLYVKADLCRSNLDVEIEATSDSILYYIDEQTLRNL